MTHATTGSDARRIVENEPPDLVVLDLRLPDVDGLDLCREFRLAAPALSIAVLTATKRSTSSWVSTPARTTTSRSRSGSVSCLRVSRANLRRPEPAETIPMELGDLRIDVGAGGSGLG